MKKVRFKVIIAALIMCLTLPVTSYAGQWRQEGGRNCYYNDANVKVVSSFITDGGYVYYLKEDGTPASGWLMIGGKWFFFLPSRQVGNVTPTNAMLTGWQWIDGKCYYLAPAANKTHILGQMYQNEATPDGFFVSASGAWSVNGSEVVEPGKGISTGPSGSSGVMSAGGGGGGGGGGGSSSGGGGSSGGGKTTPTPKHDEPVYGDEPIEDEPEPEPTLVDVKYFVHFTDVEHEKKLSRDLSGTVKEGTEIMLGYALRFVDEDGNVWEALEAPHTVTIWGPGDEHIYIEYEKTGEVPEEEDPYKEAKELLDSYIALSKEKDAIITGEETDEIPDERCIAESKSQSNLRLRTMAGQMDNDEAYELYVIGKNIVPNGIDLKNVYGNSVRYSNNVVSVIGIEDDIYTVVLFEIEMTISSDECLHDWQEEVIKEATCLKKGTKKYTCEGCGAQKTITVPATGHTDEDGDSICDNCLKRAFEQTVGSTLTATLAFEEGDEDIDFVMVDADFQGGCLYVAATELPAEKLGGYLNNEYADSGIFAFFSEIFPNAFSINGDNIRFFQTEDETAYAGILSVDEALAYKDTYGGDYTTRTKSGDGVVILAEDGTESVGDVSDESLPIRICIVLASPDAGEADPVTYTIGDVLEREIDGNTYTFTCIDENYSDKLENHEKQALFICDEIIPGDYGCDYVYKELTASPGEYGYEFVPGPIATFGENNDYKYSNIRAFLDAETVFGAADIQIGVSNSYEGATTEGKFSNLNGTALTGHSIGYQKMNARLFILSVDEAVKYKDYLFKFGNIEEDNPEDATGETKHSYWLRSPNGDSDTYDLTDMAYVVDLDLGNIHPQKIKPETATGDDYVDNITGVGVRPAFVLTQN